MNRSHIIAMVLYANPDYYPPVVNAIKILSREFDIVLICRNQDTPNTMYPHNVNVIRVGRFQTARQKELQNDFHKIIEYFLFLIRVFFSIVIYRCRFIYSYDMHGFVASFVAGHLILRAKILYHNLDIYISEGNKNLRDYVYHFEHYFAPYADKVVVSDNHRAIFFKEQLGLKKTPLVVMNTPLRIERVPTNKLKDLLSKRGVSESARIVLYQGLIADTRCILEIVRSMVHWPQDAVFVLIGLVYNAEYMADNYNEAGRLGLEDRFVVLDFIPHQELLHYTVGADIGIALFKPVNLTMKFISGASNKIFEYLSLGIPVITNDSLYSRETLDSSFAYFVNQDSIDDMGRLINAALSNDDERRRKARAAREAHLSKLNYEAQFRPVYEYIHTAI